MDRRDMLMGMAGSVLALVHDPPSEESLVEPMPESEDRSLGTTFKVNRGEIRLFDPAVCDLAAYGIEIRSRQRVKKLPDGRYQAFETQNKLTIRCVVGKSGDILRLYQHLSAARVMPMFLSFPDAFKSEVTHRYCLDLRQRGCGKVFCKTGRATGKSTALASCFIEDVHSDDFDISYLDLGTADLG